MADRRHFCVFDFETGSKDPATTQILQIGAVIINKNNLQIVDEFQSLAKPKDMDALEEEALKVNHLTKEQLEDAPDIDVVFQTWANWIQNWNVNKDKNSFGAPIPCGWGSDKFDVPIMQRYCQEYGFWDDKWGAMTLLNPAFSLDAMKHFWFWTLNNTDVKNCKLGTAVVYMGLATPDEVEKLAHDAMQDVLWTAEITKKFLGVSRWANEMNPNTKKRRLPMKDCFKKDQDNGKKS